jgi:hypothetical protein
MRLGEMFLRLQPGQKLRRFAPSARIASDRPLHARALHMYDVLAPVLVPAAYLARVDLQHDTSRCDRFACAARSVQQDQHQRGFLHSEFTARSFPVRIRRAM